MDPAENLTPAGEKPKEIADQVVLITGASDGLGRETARLLAARGAKVLLHGSDRKSQAAVASEIRKTTKNPNIDILVADFRSLSEVEHLGLEIRKTYPNVQVLINNYNIQNIARTRSRTLTEDGFEQTFQIHYLAPFLLTSLLRDKLESIRPARIVNITPSSHKGADLDFSNLQGEHRYDAARARSTSMLALTMFSIELAAQLQGTGVSSNCILPGPDGAAAAFWAATHNECEGVTGGYFEHKRLTDPDPRAKDAALRRKLWDYTEHLIQSRLIRVA